MIICQCSGVTDTAIARLIEEGVASVAEVARRSGAGRCCSPCRAEIAAMIDLRIHPPSEPAHPALASTGDTLAVP